MEYLLSFFSGFGSKAMMEDVKEIVQVTSIPSGLTSIISPTSTLSSVTLGLDVDAHRQSERERDENNRNSTSNKNNDHHHDGVHATPPDQNSKRFSFTTPLTIKCDNRSNKQQFSPNHPSLLEEELSEDETFYTATTSHPTTIDKNHSTSSNPEDLLAHHGELKKKNQSNSITQKKVAFVGSAAMLTLRSVKSEKLNKNHQTQEQQHTRNTKKIQKHASKGSPEGLKPRSRNRVRAKVGTPDGLKPRGSLDKIPIPHIKLERKGTKTSKNKGLRCRKYQNNHRKTKVKQHSVQKSHPNQQEWSNLLSPEKNESLSMPLHPPPHLERTAKKSNVSFASSSSFMVDQSTTSGIPLFSPPQQRLKVEEAQTAVGLVVAYNASLNKSDMCLSKNLSIDNSSIKLEEESGIGNENYKSFQFSNKKKYNKYVSLNGISFVPTEESKKKARSKIKEWKHNNDGAILGALPRYGPGHGQARLLLSDEDSSATNGEENYCHSHAGSDNGSATSLDDWWQYELYKEEKAREEEERLIRQQDWYNYECYKENQEMNDEKGDTDMNLNDSIDTYDSYFLFNRNKQNRHDSDNIKERESQMWEEEWNNYEQYKEEKEMEINENKKNNLDESRDRNESQQYLAQNDGHAYNLHQDEQEMDEEESQLWNEEGGWYKNYERVNDDENKSNERRNLMLDNSGDISNSSRQYLFAKRDSENLRYNCSNGYDFSPLTDEPRIKNPYDWEARKPFVVKNGEVSFISDISHTSAARSEDYTNDVLQSKSFTQHNQQENSALTGPSYHPKHPKQDFGCEYPTLERIPKDLQREINGKNDLSLLNVPTIRCEKERMLIQAVRCLKDNLQLVFEIESTFVSNKQYDSLIGTYSDKEGILTGYKNENRQELLSTLYNASLIVQERKENILIGSIEEELYDSIIFFGSLVQSAADFRRNGVKNWKPKSSLLHTIQSELQNTMSVDRKSHSHSLGATTISTRDISYTTGSKNLGICKTIATLTTLLQKVGTELESLHDDSESISESNYLYRLYLQLISLSREDLRLLINGFTLTTTSADTKTSTIKKPNNNNISFSTQMAHKKEESAFQAKVNELNIMNDALRWNVDFQPASNCTFKQKAISRPYSYHYGLPSSEHFPTMIDIPSNDASHFNKN